jgi:hypothetical protein
LNDAVAYVVDEVKRYGFKAEAVFHNAVCVSWDEEEAEDGAGTEAPSQDKNNHSNKMNDILVLHGRRRAPKDVVFR